MIENKFNRTIENRDSLSKDWTLTTSRIIQNQREKDLSLKRKQEKQQLMNLVMKEKNDIKMEEQQSNFQRIYKVEQMRREQMLEKIRQDTERTNQLQQEK